MTKYLHLFFIVLVPATAHIHSIVPNAIDPAHLNTCQSRIMRDSCEYRFTLFELIDARYPNTFTSGVMNRPNFLTGNNQDKTSKYGCYYLNRKSTFGPQTGMYVYVSYKKTPWVYADVNQTVIAIKVVHESFNVENFPVQIGLQINQVEDCFEVLKIENGLAYLKSEELNIVVLLDSKHVITKYIAWVDKIDLNYLESFVNAAKYLE